MSGPSSALEFITILVDLTTNAEVSSLTLENRDKMGVLKVSIFCSR